MTFSGAERSAMPLELKHNINCCIYDNPVQSSLQLNVSEVLDASTGASTTDSPKQVQGKYIMHKTYRKEITIAGKQSAKDTTKQLNLSLSSQLDLEELESRGNFAAITVPRYVNLEPSLAMDWLEISWEELHIKERVGAGIGSLSSCSHCNFRLHKCSMNKDTLIGLQAPLGLYIGQSGMDRSVSLSSYRALFC